MEDNRELSTAKLFNRTMSLYSTVSSLSQKPLVSISSPGSDQNSVKKWYNSIGSAGTSFKGKVRQLRTLFESPKTLTLDSSFSSSSSSSSSKLLLLNNSFNRLRPAKSFNSDFDASKIRFPGTEDRVVVYFTSLRGIRRTYEDCHAVRMIFRGFRVFVDERDVSMDAGYRKELQGLLEEKNPTLPQVFIKGRYVGGVDVIRQLNETGELRKLLQVLPVKDRRFACDSCGDARFLPCSNCSGSRKLFDEDEGVMKRCLECNENGLIRCPECCL